jgi:hypothetical protein
VTQGVTFYKGRPGMNVCGYKVKVDNIQEVADWVGGHVHTSGAMGQFVVFMRQLFDGSQEQVITPIGWYLLSDGLGGTDSFDPVLFEKYFEVER